MDDKAVPTKLAVAQYSFYPTSSNTDPWSPSDVDKLESPKHDDYRKLVKECRFFYRKDPIASTVINKMIDIGITDITFNRNKLSQNQMGIFYALEKDLKKFSEELALELLLTGLIVPEISYERVSTEPYKEYGLKKITSIYIPTSMWIRDSATIVINSSMLGAEPSYFIKVPDEMVYFIQHGGMYPDGTRDVKLYTDMLKFFPEFIAKVKAGEVKILLENNNITRRRVSTDSPYPTPYLAPALESLKHKRNLKRLDYSIAARAIGAIQQFKVGNDEYPVTADESDIFENLKNQMRYRNSGNKDVERIFQLFTNHTVEIQWIYPPVEALLDDQKYNPVNEDIFLALGFPRILTTGETLKSNTSDATLATLSPIRTMESIRSQLLTVIQNIVRKVAVENKLPEVPVVEFEPINLQAFGNFLSGLLQLYKAGALSRQTVAETFGYDFQEEAEKLKEDVDLMVSLGLEQDPMEVIENQQQMNNPQNNSQEKSKETSKKDKKVDNSGENK